MAFNKNKRAKKPEIGVKDGEAERAKEGGGGRIEDGSKAMGRWDPARRIKRVAEIPLKG